MAHRQMADFNRKWLGELPICISRKALEHIVRQYNRAAASIQHPQDPQRRLPPAGSNCYYSYRFRLPKDLIHTRWWLRQPLDVEEPLRRIQDPDVVQNLRGRPRAAVNNKINIPASLTLAGTAAPIEPSQNPPIQPDLPQLGRSSRQSTRPLRSSVRRTRTQAELAG
ncbi:hypothetical protein MY1884_008783 [Beauveria asiatica]